MAIQFKMNDRKAVECVLWLIQRGETDMRVIWKMLFAAEKYHLNAYGRPVTGDSYMAAECGTVPDRLCDIVNGCDSGKDFARDG